MKLKLSDWASVAEVIGAVAIVVSMVYVAIELNDSTRAVRSASANDAAAMVQSWYLEIGKDPVAGRIALDGMTDPDSLSREEMLQYIYMMHAIFIALQNSWYLASEGTLDLELRDTVTNAILGIRDQPGMNVYWFQRRGLFKPAFQEYVDELLSSGTTNTDMERIYAR